MKVSYLLSILPGKYAKSALIRIGKMAVFNEDRDI